jgi:hypothetical protein
MYYTLLQFWQNLAEFYGLAEFGRILWLNKNLAEFHGLTEFGRIQ